MVFVSYNNIVSPLGYTTIENYTAITQGIIAVKPTQLPFSKETFCVALTDDEKTNTLFGNLLNEAQYTKLEKLSILSITDVLHQSGINPQDEKTLLIYSTTKGNIDVLENRYPQFSNDRVYLHQLTAQLQNHFKFKNTPIVLSNACISGVLAIAMAKRFIESKHYNHVLVCGGDIISEFTLSGFKSFNALSSKPSKPFDADRVGINLGEAVATILITNDNELAKNYSTQIVAGASANDANHISGPSRTGDGLFQCLKQLPIKETEGIGFISAHGTATPFNDEMESIAFERAELQSIPVNSLKGYYGHSLGAAGVLETILSLESLKNQQLIKSQGYETKGVSGNISLIEAHKPSFFQAFIKTASGFGGCNAAVLFKKYNV